MNIWTLLRSCARKKSSSSTSLSSQDSTPSTPASTLKVELLEDRLPPGGLTSGPGLLSSWDALLSDSSLESSFEQAPDTTSGSTDASDTEIVSTGVDYGEPFSSEPEAITTESSTADFTNPTNPEDDDQTAFTARLTTFEPPQEETASGTSLVGPATSTGTGSSAPAIASGPGTSGTSGLNPSVDGFGTELRLLAPTYTANTTPTVMLRAMGNYASEALVDVDLNQNGTFENGELGYAKATFNEEGSASVQLSKLAKGTYQLRARVDDLNGEEVTSQSRTMEVSDDPRAKMPLHFEKNVGQSNGPVEYLSRGRDYVIFLTPDAMVLSVEADASALPEEYAYYSQSSEDLAISEVLSIQFGGPLSYSTEIVGLDELPGVSNYLVGNDSEQHFTGIANYSQVQYSNLYDGIDLIVQGEEGSLRHDFVVNPGADPHSIMLYYEGAQNLSVNDDGQLIVEMVTGTIAQSAPVIYQHTSQGLSSVEGEYVVQEGFVSFEIGEYDTTKALIIDPTLVYSTFQGSTGDDSGRGLDIDTAGNAYVVGDSPSANFPTTTGVFQATLGGGRDVVVQKVNPQGTALVYSTFIGGTADDRGFDIDVDAGGNAYVAGDTRSNNFDTTTGAFDTTFGGIIDGFVSKLNAAGTQLLYSTYIGDSAADTIRGLDVENGEAYVVGNTQSANFNTTTGAFQTTRQGNSDAFVTKLNTAGSGQVYSTFLGGTGLETAREVYVSGGQAYVVGDTNSTDFDTTTGAFQTTRQGGSDAFVTKVNAAGNGLTYSTYLGGTGDEDGFGIVVDAAGSAYVVGDTNSTDFDTVAGAFQANNRGGTTDGFVTKLNTQGSGLVYSTYLGGTFEDELFAIDIDSQNRAYVTGRSVNVGTQNYPLQGQITTPGFNGDAILTVLQANGAGLVFSNLFGGFGPDRGEGIRVDAQNNVYLAGTTRSNDFPTLNAIQRTRGGVDDFFVLRVDDSTITPPPPPPPGGGPGGPGGPGGQNFAGDTFESNNTSDKATNLGTISGPREFQGLTINRASDGTYDFDWYRVKAATAGSLSVTLTETAGGDLELQLFRVVNNSMTPGGSSSGAGTDSHGVTLSVAAGEEILIHVKGVNRSSGVMDLGTYDMSLNLV